MHRDLVCTLDSFSPSGDILHLYSTISKPRMVYIYSFITCVDSCHQCYHNQDKEWCHRASLVVQRLRIHLAMRGVQVRFLIQEDPTGCGATKPMCLGPMLGNKRSQGNEKPANQNQRAAPAHHS